MTHADRWWATYNAALSAYSSEGDSLVARQIHEIAAEQADLAHGELDAVDIASLEHAVEDVVNNAESLALDDEDDRNRLIVALQQAIKKTLP